VSQNRTETVPDYYIYCPTGYVNSGMICVTATAGNATPTTTMPLLTAGGGGISGSATSSVVSALPGNGAGVIGGGAGALSIFVAGAVLVMALGGVIAL